jgi:hypothetical protein
MLFINDSDKRPFGLDTEGKDRTKPTPMTVDIVRPDLGRIMAKPGETVEIRDCYARPGRTVGGGRRPSVIENLAPQLRPANPDELAEWEKAPPAVNPGHTRATAGGTIPDIQELIASGMPPKAARAKVAKLMAEQSLKEQGEDE